MSNERLVISVPTLDGNISAVTANAIFHCLPSASFIKAVAQGGQVAAERLAQAFDVEMLDTYLIPYGIAWTRSRAARMFLEQTDGTHLLSLDADISFDPPLLRKMLDKKKDCIGVAYPRRTIRWILAEDAVRQGKAPEIGAYTYTMRKVSGDTVVRSDLLEVDGIGMGCVLFSRRCLEAMTWAYGEAHDVGTLAYGADSVPKVTKVFEGLTISRGAEDLRCHDAHPNPNYNGTTVMPWLQYQRRDPDGRLTILEEDYAWSHRWRAIGGQIHLYTGPFAPASHVGTHYFQGTREGFVHDVTSTDPKRGKQT